MSDTTFISQVTQITAPWAQDVNNTVYHALGSGGVAPSTPQNVLDNLGLSGASGAAEIGFSPVDGLVSTQVQAAIAEVNARIPVTSTYVSVKDYGAIGNGVADDTVAIQAAITAVEAAGGGTVFFPQESSFYKISAPLLVRGDINIELLGSGNPMIKCFGVGPTSNGFTVGDPGSLRSAYVTFRNLKIWGNSQTNGHGIRIQMCNNVRVENCSIYNHGQTGLFGSDTYSMRIENSEFVSNGTSGIYLITAGANSTIITRNKIIGHSASGQSGVLIDGAHFGCIIDSNDFEFNWHGIKANQIHGLSVVNNYFETCTHGAVYIQSGSTVRGLSVCNNAILDSYVDISSVNGLVVENNTFEKSGNVLLLNGNSNSRIGENSFPGGGTIVWGTNADTDEFQAHGEWTEYTTSQWLSSSSPQPSIGNGVYRMWYKKMGKTVHVRFQWQAGTTTTFGTGNWVFSLPANVNTSVTNARWIGTARYNHAGTISYNGIVPECNWALGSSMLLVNATGGSLVGVTSPFVWASGDEIHVEIVYEAA